MAAKFSVFSTLVLLLLDTGRLRVLSSTSDGQPLIDQAQAKLDDMTLLLMRESGYDKTDSILHANLKRFIHECEFMRSNITIFAPRDETMAFNREFMPPFPVQILWPPFPEHILIHGVEEEEFWSNRILKGTRLYPVCEPTSSVNVTENPKCYPGRLSIGNARALHWKIYHDDVMVVHWFDNFFDVTSHYTYGGEYLFTALVYSMGKTPSLPGWNFERVYGNRSV